MPVINIEILGEINGFFKSTGQIRSAFDKIVLDIKSDVELNSPKDSGAFASKWDLDRKSTKTLYTNSIFNSMDYARVLDHGSIPGQKPWPGVGPKTVSHDGKIWSRQAKGGIISKVDIDGYIQDFSDSIMNMLVGI